mgnify:CR=1 FL=1
MTISILEGRNHRDLKEGIVGGTVGEGVDGLPGVARYGKDFAWIEAKASGACPSGIREEGKPGGVAGEKGIGLPLRDAVEPTGLADTNRIEDGGGVSGAVECFKPAPFQGEGFEREVADEGVELRGEGEQRKEWK